MFTETVKGEMSSILKHCYEDYIWLLKKCLTYTVTSTCWP